MAPRPLVIIDPTQPLPRLTLEPLMVDKGLTFPGLLAAKLTLDPWLEGTLQDMRASNVLMGTAQTFPPAYLVQIEKQFRPTKHKDGMGCMEACYSVLAILYTQKVSRELQKEIWNRAWKKAVAYANAHPGELKQKIADAMAANPMLIEKDVKRRIMEEWTSPHNTSDHLYALMGERGLAEQKVNTPNTKAEATIRSLTGESPGLYFFGLAVRDNHTVTLAVERGSDGSQRMFWLDQNQPGKSRVIHPGELGDKLAEVRGHTESTNIYAVRPPIAGWE